MSKNIEARDQAFDAFILSTKELYDRPVSKSGKSFGYSDAEEYAFDYAWATSRNRLLDELEFMAQDCEADIVGPVGHPTSQMLLERAAFIRRIKQRLIEA